MPASGQEPVDPFASSGGGGMPFDLTALLQTARKYFWLPLCLIPVGVVGAFLYAKSTAPIYRASAELRLEKPMAPAASLTGIIDTSMNSDEINTSIRTFINPSTARVVVEKLKLTERPDFLDTGEKFASEGAIIDYLTNNTKATLVTGTKLLLVSVDYRSPDVAMELANAMAEAGVDWDREQRAAALRQNVKYLEDEVRQLEEKLTDSERKLTDYGRDLGAVSIDQNLNIESDKLRDLNMRAIDAHAQRMQLESSFKEIQVFRNDPDGLLGIESIRSAPGVSSLITKTDDMKANVARLSKRYRPGSPFMIQAQTELNQMEASLRNQALDVAQGIEASLAIARSNEAAVAAEKASQEKKVIKVTEESIPANVLRRQVDTDRLAYEAALKKRNEELSQTRSQSVTMQVYSLAGPGYMVSMGTGKMVAMGGLGAFFAGLGIIFLIAQLDKSLKTVEATEKAFRLPVLAAVPNYEFPKEKEEYNLFDFPTMQGVPSPAIEAFRTLKVAIDPPDSPRERGIILMVGSVEGEGTSFCSLNLAVIMGRSGERTLLVDANLRKPSLEQQIFESSGHYGLSDYLLGTASFSNILRSTAAENVDVVTAGTPCTDPVDVLSRSNFAKLISEADSLYDRIIFDAAPLSEVSDTLGFVRHCQTICLVARAGKTSPVKGARVVELLDRAGVNPFGVVLNDVQSLFPVALKRRIEPVEVLDSNEVFDFPVSCPSCSRSYESLEDFMQRTAPPVDDWPNRVGGSANRGQRLVRRCVCNALIVLPPAKRRDVSSNGAVRREVFAELLNVLIKSGLARNDARTQLLLTLKIWRTESNGESLREDSEVSGGRRKLYDEIQQHLIQGGLSAGEADEKLRNAIKIWQHAP